MKKLTTLLIALAILAAACGEKPAESEDERIADSTEQASVTMGVTENTPPGEPEVEGLDIVQIAGCGINRFTYLTSDGRVFARGDNQFGALGVGDFEEHEGLVQVRIPEPIKLIGNQVAVTFDNHIYVWGVQRLEDEELLAQQNWPEGYDVPDMAILSTPVRLDFGKPIVQIYNSWEFTNLLTEDGDVYTWGNIVDRWEQPPIIGDYYPSQNPVRVNFPERIVEISSGYTHTLALGESGTLYGYGRASGEQLGAGILTLIHEQALLYYDELERIYNEMLAEDPTRTDFGFAELLAVEDYVVITDEHDIISFSAGNSKTFFVCRNNPTLLQGHGYMGMNTEGFYLNKDEPYQFPGAIVEIVYADSNVVVRLVDGSIYAVGVFRQGAFNLEEMKETFIYTTRDLESSGVSEFGEASLAVLREPTLIATADEIGEIFFFGLELYYTDADGQFMFFNEDTNRSEVLRLVENDVG
jgi:alpha-tubulin suppressor-like RCC1 family protein